MEPGLAQGLGLAGWGVTGHPAAPPAVFLRQNRPAEFCELHRGGAAGRAGADHNHVIVIHRRRSELGKRRLEMRARGHFPMQQSGQTPGNTYPAGNRRDDRNLRRSAPINLGRRPFRMHQLVSATVVTSRRWWVLAILVAAQFMFGVDAFIVNVAIPTIAVELHASPAQIESVIAIYLIAY